MSVPLNLGIRAHDFGEIPLPELVGKIKEYGFSHIQLAVRKSFPESAPSFSALSPGTAAYYGDAFRREGIRIAVLGCYVSIVHSDPATRKQALADFGTHLRLARDFGAGLVGTETGRLYDRDTEDNYTEEAFQEVVASVREMTSIAEHFGATVGIEAAPKHVLNSAPQVRRLLDLVQSDNLQVILDCTNLANAGNAASHDDIVREALELLGDRIAVLHLKDFAVEDGRTVIVPPGQGVVNFERILHYMKYQRPHIQGILEEYREPYIKESADYLRRLYDKL